MSKPKTQKVAVRLPVELVAALDDFAADQFISFSDALRRAAIAGLVAEASDIGEARFKKDYAELRRKVFGARME